MNNDTLHNQNKHSEGIASNENSLTSRKIMQSKVGEA
jgi:hypothetical protein